VVMVVVVVVVVVAVLLVVVEVIVVNVFWLSKVSVVCVCVLANCYGIYCIK